QRRDGALHLLAWRESPRPFLRSGHVPRSHGLVSDTVPSVSRKCRGGVTFREFFLHFVHNPTAPERVARSHGLVSDTASRASRKVRAYERRDLVRINRRAA